MGQSVTGYRAGATSVVRGVDVAALISAAILATHPDALALPFDTQVHGVRLNRRDTVMTNASRLAALGGGGTDCSAPLRWINQHRTAVDVVIMVSDNESWFDPNDKRYSWQAQRATAVMREWSQIKQRNPQAKLVCIDLVPNSHTQACNSEDVLNVGGFSDAVFTVMEQFIQGNKQQWLATIETQTL